MKRLYYGWGRASGIVIQVEVVVIVIVVELVVRGRLNCLIYICVVFEGVSQVLDWTQSWGSWDSEVSVIGLAGDRLPSDRIRDQPGCFQFAVGHGGFRLYAGLVEAWLLLGDVCVVAAVINILPVDIHILSC